MDTRTEQATDVVLQAELLRNERIIQHPTFGAVRLRRPTPGQERQIADIRRKQYQTDLRNDDILSKDQITALAIKRGMWSEDTQERIDALMKRTGEAMGVLDSVGFKGIEALTKEYLELTAKLSAVLPETDEVKEVVNRYFDLTLKTSLKDRTFLVQQATSTEADDLLDTGDNLRVQIELLQELGKVRKELQTLQEKQTRLFVDSLESRTDRAEELARIYYCATGVETGKPLWPTFEDIWSAPPEEIEVLVLEMHYFVNGVSDEFKETLAKYGFLKRQSDTSGSSDDSPVLPPSNSDGESAETPTTVSSAATA